MTKDLDSGEVVVSSIKTGLKREFDMMMKADWDKGEVNVGQRRVTRSQSAGGSSRGNVGSAGNTAEKVKGPESKRMKKVDGVGKLGVVEADVGVELRGLQVEVAAAERAGTDVKEGSVQPSCAEPALAQVRSNDEDDGAHEITVEGASDSRCKMAGEAASESSEKLVRRFTRSALKSQDEEPNLKSGAGVPERGTGATSTSSQWKSEAGMSQNVESKMLPTKLKDLLQTGLLEGLNVRYIRGSKSRTRSETVLEGVIQGAGILCSCNLCKGEKIVSPNQFEMHANSGNRNPPDYMYLDNGKSLRDVLDACKAAHSESLETVIQNVMGCPDSRTSTFCLNCGELIPEASAGRPMRLCGSCMSKESVSTSAQIVDAVPRSPVARVADSPALAASNSEPEAPESAPASSNSQPCRESGRRLTKKDLNMHKAVLKGNLIPDGAVLHYVVQGKKMLEGFKQPDAIFCSCCEKLLSASQFEAHAGFASRRKPYDNIFTSNGVSLHTLSLGIQESSLKEKDDLCSICKGGGDLRCCDKCPRAFHPECVGISRFPQGTWYCRNCQNMFRKAKYEENSANAIAAGRVPGVDPLEEITRRCIRIVETWSYIGGCAICSGHDFTKKGFDDRTVIICDQCEKEYHVGCLREQKMEDLKALPEGDWLCCKECKDINSTLCRLIEESEHRLPEALFNIVKKKLEQQGLEDNNELDIKWRMIKGAQATEDTGKLLSDAVSIFHERFDPIADSRTGSRDLIPHMVQGKQFRNQDYGGMYSALLMVNSVVVCAALFRIFGKEVAEIPLVATKSECQGKGYFQSLFFCIEELLASLKVKDLVLPAADEAESLWKDRFGFEKLGQEQVDQYKKKYHNMMIFQETSVLHKLISKSETATPSHDENTSSTPA